MKKQTIWLIVLLLWLTPFPSFAEETEMELFTLTEPTSVVVHLEWEVEEPSFTLISPAGRTIQADTISDDIAIVKLEQTYIILIREAAAGSWRLLYDKKSNESITVMVDEYVEGFWITQFDVEPPSNQQLNTTFVVEHDEAVQYTYTLSLAMDEGGAEQLLDSGTARTNEAVQRQLNLEQINSYDHYVLKLHVTYEHQDASYFDMAYSEPFAYENERAQEPLRDVNVSVDVSSETLTIDWSGYLPYRADDVLVKVFEGEEIEPVFVDAFPAEQSSVSLPFNADASSTHIEVQWRQDGLLSKPLRKTIQADRGFSLQFGMNEDEDRIVTNVRQFSFRYEQAQEQPVQVSLNDQMEQIVLDGDGEKWIELEEGFNTIELTFVDDIGVEWIYAKELYVDVVPPLLEMLEPFDGITTTQKSFTIHGQTEPNARVTINDQEVELSPGGFFSHSLELSGGANEVIIRASDPAGNASTWQGVIHRATSASAVLGSADSSGDADGGENTGWMHYLPLIMTLVISVALSIWVIVSWKHRGNGKLGEQREEVV